MWDATVWLNFQHFIGEKNGKIENARAKYVLQGTEKKKQLMLAERPRKVLKTISIKKQNGKNNAHKQRAYKLQSMLCTKRTEKLAISCRLRRV